MTDVLDVHDALLADLDGTLYRGRAAVPGAAEAVRGAIARGVRIAYVTNNASRRPVEVAEHLTELGFPAGEQDVVASSQAAAALLGGRLERGSPVLVVGTDALAEEVRRVGLAVTAVADDAVAVVQGHSPDTGWRQLAEAAVALRAGAVWVACNTDTTMPTERGLLPGNGSMVAALRTASSREPQVAGKPAPALFVEAARRAGARAPVVVGDRLDTDVVGARAAGMTTLLVLTGVCGPAELLAAPEGLRPDLIGADLSALTARPEELAPGPRAGWEVGAGPVLRGRGDPLDALRALCAAHWATGGGPARVSAGDDGAAAAVRALGLEHSTGARPVGVSPR